MLKQKEDGEEIFKTPPIVQTEFKFAHQIRTESTRRNWLNDIRGKWPGDESIDDLIKELENR